MNKCNDILELLKSSSYQLAMEKLNQAHYFPINSGLKITLICLDYAEGEFTLEADQTGKLNNGLLFTLADEIASIAACSRGVSYVTISSCINFLKDTASGKIVCRAMPQRSGEDISIFQVAITDEVESLVAAGSFVFQMKI